MREVLRRQIRDVEERDLLPIGQAQIGRAAADRFSRHNLFGCDAETAEIDLIEPQLEVRNDGLVTVGRNIVTRMIKETEQVVSRAARHGFSRNTGDQGIVAAPGLDHEAGCCRIITWDIGAVVAFVDVVPRGCPAAQRVTAIFAGRQ